MRKGVLSPRHGGSDGFNPWWFALLAMVALAIHVPLFAAMTLWFESGHPDSHIQTFSDATWVTLMAISTIGYGDLVPLTLGARITNIVAFVACIGFMTVLGLPFYLQAVSLINNAVRRQDSRRHHLENRRYARMISRRMDQYDDHLDQVMSKLDRLEQLMDREAVRNEQEQKDSPPAK
ncbi:potassium channel family protein [Ferrimonas marina]|nr:potassium channel family protein [Ferrimonas marina]